MAASWVDLWLKMTGLVYKTAATQRTSNEPRKLWHWLCHDDKTENIIMTITITNINSQQLQLHIRTHANEDVAN